MGATSPSAVVTRDGARPLRRAWVRACVVGELVGFVPPAVTGATLVWLGAPEVVLVVGLVAAGAVEGLVLGRAQATVIAGVLPTVSGWARATAAAAALAWLAGMGGSSLLQAVGAWALVVTVPGWIVGLLAMGVLQADRLRSVSSLATRWIPYTTGAWALGVTIPVVVLSVIPNGWPPVAHVIAGVAAAVAMGATVGWCTARPLQAIVEQPDRLDATAP